MLSLLKISSSLHWLAHCIKYSCPEILTCMKSNGNRDGLIRYPSCDQKAILHSIDGDTYIHF